MPSFSPVGLTPRPVPLSPVQRQFQDGHQGPQGPLGPQPQGPGGPFVQPGSQLFDVLNRTNQELQQSLNSLASVPPELAGQADYTQLRRTAYDANMRAQNWLASGFQDLATPSNIVQTLHEADAKLEYANWKTVGKDPRTQQFVGFDIIGAMNDTMTAATMVQALLQSGPTPPGPTPPGPTPPGPTPPGSGLPQNVMALLGGAASEAATSMSLLQQVPQGQGDNPQYTPNRKEAYNHNLASQKSLEQLFHDSSIDQTQMARIHEADSQLETANWGTVGKDPRTNAKVPVNLQSALSATNNARSILDELLHGTQPQVEPLPDNGSGQQPQVDPPVGHPGQSSGSGDG